MQPKKCLIAQNFGAVSKHSTSQCGSILNLPDPSELNKQVMAKRRFSSEEKVSEESLNIGLSWNTTFQRQSNSINNSSLEDQLNTLSPRLEKETKMLPQSTEKFQKSADSRSRLSSSSSSSLVSLRVPDNNHKVNYHSGKIRAPS